MGKEIWIYTVTVLARQLLQTIIWYCYLEPMLNCRPYWLGIQGILYKVSMIVARYYNNIIKITDITVPDNNSKKLINDTKIINEKFCQQ